MPQALPLTDKIDQRTFSRQRVNRVLSVQFGDGYSQEAPDGLNADYDTLTLSYIPLDSTDRDTVWTALDAVGAFDYFTYQPPGFSSSKKWKVVKDSVREQPRSGTRYVISFQLKQTF